MKMFIIFLIPYVAFGVILYRRPQVSEMSEERIQLQNVVEYNATHIEDGWVPAESSCVPGASSSGAVPEESALIDPHHVPLKRGPKRRGFKVHGPFVPIIKDLRNTINIYIEHND